MKDNLIFILSIILVIAGTGYLGYTAYKFFTRDQTPVQNEVSNGTEDTQGASSSVLELEGSPSQDVIAEDLRIGDSVSISADIRNTGEERAEATFEGRVYKVDEVNTFPDFNADLPLDLYEFPVSVNAGDSSEYSYEYTVEECGDFYITIAESGYWRDQSGVVSYGYFTAPCDTAGAVEGAKGDLTPVNITREQSTVSQRENVQGTTDGATTKGGVQELPKAGNEGLFAAIGVILLGSGLVYNRKLINSV